MTTNTMPDNLPTRIQEMIQHIETRAPEWKVQPFKYGEVKMTMSRSTRNYNAFPGLPNVIIKITIEADGKSIEFHVGMLSKKDAAYKELYAVYDADKKVRHFAREGLMNEEAKGYFDNFDEMLGHFLANKDDAAVAGGVSFLKQVDKAKRKEKERAEEIAEEEEDEDGVDSINGDDSEESVSDDPDDEDVEEEDVESEAEPTTEDSSSASSSSSSSEDSEEERRERRRRRKDKKRDRKARKINEELKKQLKKTRKRLAELEDENRRLKKKAKK